MQQPGSPGRCPDSPADGRGDATGGADQSEDGTLGSDLGRDGIRDSSRGESSRPRICAKVSKSNHMGRKTKRAPANNLGSRLRSSSSPAHKKARGNDVEPTDKADEPAAAAPTYSGAAGSGAAPRAADVLSQAACEEPGDERPREVQRLLRDLEAAREQNTVQRRRYNVTHTRLQATRQMLTRLLVQVANIEDAQEREQASAASAMLGIHRTTTLPGNRVSTTWEGGFESEDVARLKDRIREDRQQIERLRRRLTARERKARLAGGGDDAAAGGDDAAAGDEDTRGGDDADDLLDQPGDQRDIFSYRMQFLAREENLVKEREQRLAVDRSMHGKTIQRLEAATRSTFRHYPFLNDRYQLLNMIGRGGFSEVYRAYDLENNKYCAVKIHELGNDMTDQQRQSYIRRAMREYDIQKTLKHPRVVTLEDCFAISSKAFGTVLELCEGETLDQYMKRCGPLSEKESRGIVIQILSGLKYMNTKGRKIIHYDLKPGNLFFHCGEIKIADFGLSKIVQENFGGESIDLTSQGAGTYWYLPRECFVAAGQPAKISNKVDVWSTGVIFYELLYNRRPFGHGQSQEALLRSAMVGMTFSVEIPAGPQRVSNDAKDFIRRLLTDRREERPDVMDAFNDPYLRPKSRSASAGT